MKLQESEELLKEAAALMTEFVIRCEIGEVRSVRTYMSFKTFLDKVPNNLKPEPNDEKLPLRFKR